MFVYFDPIKIKKVQKTVLPSVCFHCSLEIKNKPIIAKSPKEELYFCCLGCSIAYQTITAKDIN